MFLTIISDEYTAVKENLKKKQNNEQDMIIDRFRYMIGKLNIALSTSLEKNLKTKRRLSRIFGLEKTRLMKLNDKERRHELVRKRSRVLLSSVQEKDTTETKECTSLEINKYAVLPTEALKNAGAKAKWAESH